MDLMEAPQNNPGNAAPADENARERHAFARRIDCAPAPRNEPVAVPPQSERGGGGAGCASREGT
jgi:hypothetical protein